MPQINAEAAKDMSWLVKIAEQMLRPIARILVGKLACPVAITLLKEAYIAEARRQMLKEQPGRRVTKSALALWTGLDTRANIAAGKQKKCRKSCLPATFVRKPPCCTRGIRKHATRTAKPKSRKISPFMVVESACRRWCRGLPVATLPRPLCWIDWRRMATSKLVPGDFVRMLNPSYVPVTDNEQKIMEASCASIGHHAEAIAHNLEVESVKPDWSQQEATSIRIPPEKIDELRGKLDKLIADQVKAADKAIKPAQSPGKRADSHSIAVGYYYWQDEIED